MHILILTANKVIKNLLHYVFLQSGCYCKTVDSLSCLFREIKNQVPHCIILDKDFFPFSYTPQELRCYLRSSIFLEKFDFLIFLYDKLNADSFKIPLFKSTSCTVQTENAVKTILNNVIKKIDAIDKDPQGFTPVEKKLYTLLKNRAEEELSFWKRTSPAAKCWLRQKKAAINLHWKLIAGSKTSYFMDAAIRSKTFLRSSGFTI